MLGRVANDQGTIVRDIMGEASLTHSCRTYPTILRTREYKSRWLLALNSRSLPLFTLRRTPLILKDPIIIMT